MKNIESIVQPPRVTKMCWNETFMERLENESIRVNFIASQGDNEVWNIE